MRQTNSILPPKRYTSLPLSTKPSTCHLDVKHDSLVLVRPNEQRRPGRLKGGCYDGTTVHSASNNCTQEDDLTSKVSELLPSYLLQNSTE